MITNRFLSRTGFISLVALTIVLIIGAIHFQTISKLRSQAGTVSFLVVELQEEIGFGGLIHNFKNALIRPAETSYSKSAEVNATRALEIIEELEKLQRGSSDPVSLQDTREMVQAYKGHLKTLAESYDRGLEISLVDEIVRFDDAPALQEISEFHARFLTRTRYDIRRAEIQSFFLLAALTALILATMYLLGNNELILQRHEDQEALERSNVQLKESNEKLNRSNSALQQFAGIASHDLKAPARQVGMFADLILSEADNRDFVEECAGNIKNASESMRSLIEALLKFTRDSFAVPVRTETDMTGLVERVVSRDLRLQADGADIVVHPLPKAFVDPELMARVWENLISNGLKYVRDVQQPQITIEGSSDGTEVIYSIADNGIGIPEKFAAQIFNPLRRLHGENSSYKGDGIGLSTVKSIIEAHGGTVELDTSYKNGARFVINLPAANMIAP